MQTVFGSVKKRSASSPPSRPTPLCFVPPKGRAGFASVAITLLIETLPVMSREATRSARAEVAN